MLMHFTFQLYLLTFYATFYKSMIYLLIIHNRYMSDIFNTSDNIRGLFTNITKSLFFLYEFSSVLKELKLKKIYDII